MGEGGVQTPSPPSGSAYDSISFQLQKKAADEKCGGHSTYAPKRPSRQWDELALWFNDHLKDKSAPRTVEE